MNGEELREALAEALEGASYRGELGTSGLYRSECERAADVILPVVERYAARRAAEALRQGDRERLGVTCDCLGPPYYTCAHWPALAADGTKAHPAHRHDETETGRG